MLSVCLQGEEQASPNSDKKKDSGGSAGRTFKRIEYKTGRWHEIEN